MSDLSYLLNARDFKLFPHGGFLERHTQQDREDLTIKNIDRLSDALMSFFKRHGNESLLPLASAVSQAEDYDGMKYSDTKLAILLGAYIYTSQKAGINPSIAEINKCMQVFEDAKAKFQFRSAMAHTFCAGE